MTKRVADLMKTSVETLHPEEDLDLAAMLMRIERFHHLPVVDGGAVIGVVSARDVLRAEGDGTAHERRRRGLRLRAREVMRQPVLTIGPDATVSEAAALMHGQDVGCLPVVVDGALVGIVTRTDLLGLLVASPGPR